MRKQALGSCEVSVIGMGTAEFGGRHPEGLARDLLDAYVSIGGNLVDTARVYGDFATPRNGESEKIVGLKMLLVQPIDIATFEEKGNMVVAFDAVGAGEGEVVMPGGHMTVEQLTALLNTIPAELTFVDADNINRYFNEGHKVFKRPGMAIDREVFSCHPPKIEPMVRAILDDFRNGRRDRVPVWMEKNGRTVLVTYMAVRDRDRKYLGTLEVVQDMEFAKEHFAQ